MYVCIPSVHLIDGYLRPHIRFISNHLKGIFIDNILNVRQRHVLAVSVSQSLSQSIQAKQLGLYLNKHPKLKFIKFSCNEGG